MRRSAAQLFPHSPAGLRPQLTHVATLRSHVLLRALLLNRLLDLLLADLLELLVLLGIED